MCSAKAIRSVWCTSMPERKFACRTTSTAAQMEIQPFSSRYAPHTTGCRSAVWRCACDNLAGDYPYRRCIHISIDGTKGYAIVEGSELYEVEFEYKGGEISRMICSCFCSYNCKHEFAALLQLKETLEMIEKHYAAQYDETGYFAAVNKGTLFAFAIDGKEAGSFTI